MNIVVQELRLRYKNTVLGFFWSLLYPLLLLAVLYFVFSKAFSTEVDNYALFLLSGIILWRFFILGTTKGLSAIVDNMEIIRSVYFPRLILVLAATIFSLITCLFELSIYMLLHFFIYGFSSAVLIIIPVLILEFCLILTINLILATIYCFYRDMYPVWQIFLQVGFFITPVFYPLSRVPEKYLKYFMLNPIARLLELLRNILFQTSGRSAWLDIVFLFLIILGLGTIGFTVFLKNEHLFVKSTK